MSRSDTQTQPTVVPDKGGRAARLGGYLVGAAVVLVLAASGLFIASYWRAHHPAATDGVDVVANVPPAWVRPAVSAAGLVDRSGVKVVYVATTGQGGLVDLRFQVVDPDKAAAVHNPSTPPAVVDEKTGLVVNQLLMSHAHSGAYDAGATYYLIFENPGNLLQSGSKVSVLLGNAQVMHITVR